MLRTGDLGKIFLLYPDAWLNGTPKRATIRAFNRGLGVASLVALFVSFALLHHRLFGVALVAVLGSNPYQVVEPPHPQQCVRPPDRDRVADGRAARSADS